MLAIQAIKSFTSKINDFLARKAEYSQLSRLDPYLLEDMGLKLENGKVLSTRKDPDLETGKTLNAVDECATLAKSSEQSAALEPPPRSCQG